MSYILISGFHFIGILYALVPIGAIVAWTGQVFSNSSLSNGWQRCDGSKIMEGPMKNSYTPNLNGGELYLRGANDSYLMNHQDDQIGNHGHQISDPGHSHIDRGHSHPYRDHGGYGWIGDYGKSGPKKLASWDDNSRLRVTTSTGKASISSQATNIKIQGVTGGKTGSETRPKSMTICWIMKIY